MVLESRTQHAIGQFIFPKLCIVEASPGLIYLFA